jgi:hypothetical protein
MGKQIMTPNITTDYLMTNGEVKGNFDESFVSKMIDCLPKILKIDTNELTFGTISKEAKLPRPQVGKFLQAVSDLKDWPIGVISRKPFKKDKIETTAKTTQAKSTTGGDNSGEKIRVIKEIIEILKMPPIDDVIGVNYASIPHLSDETKAPIEFVTDVVNYLIENDIVVKYDGENEFEEDIFTLSEGGLESKAKEAKEVGLSGFETGTKDTEKQTKPKRRLSARQKLAEQSKTQKPAPVAKEASKPAPVTKEASKPAPVAKEKSNAEQAEQSSSVAEFSAKTLEAVRRALKADKYTRNGILKKVAKRGVHKRDDVLAAFNHLIETEVAKPTLDGGAREYFSIPVKKKATTEKQTTESEQAETANIVEEQVKEDVALADSLVEEAAQEPAPDVNSITENEAVVEEKAVEASVSKAPEEAIISGVSGNSKETSSINKVLQETFLKMANMVNEGQSFDEISKHIKSAEYLIQAAKALE